MLFRAHHSNDSFTPFYYLSKAIEIARELLPGKNDKEIEEKLPKELFKEKKLTFNQLMNLSNTRLETRHAIKRHTTKLHDKMTLDEINIFKVDSEMIIRYLICEKLEIPLLLVKRNY